MNVSKEHATVLYDQGKYFLADLGSVNSTFIKIDNKIVLREGTVLDFGKDNLFVVHLVLNPNPPETPHTYDSSILDPYNLYVDGKIIWNEYKMWNTNMLGLENSGEGWYLKSINSELCKASIQLRDVRNNQDIISISEDDMRK